MNGPVRLLSKPGLGVVQYLFQICIFIGSGNL